MDASDDARSFIAAFTFPILISLENFLIVSFLPERELTGSLCWILLPSWRSSEMLPSFQSVSLFSRQEMLSLTLSLGRGF